jgi:hypothetical protein
MDREDIVSEVAKVWDRRAMEDELTHASIKIMAQHVEIEQLREANELMLTDIRRTDVDMLAFKAEIERLRAALVALRDGCETRPVGTRYREDGQPSKHDKCIHGVWMYEDCGQCVSLFVEAALAQKANDVC